MPDTTCPGCGATMQTVYEGELQDKHRECRHCGHRRDVADSFTTVRSETVRTERPGAKSVRTTRVVRSRTDLHGSDAIGAMDVMAEASPLLRMIRDLESCPPPSVERRVDAMLQTWVETDTGTAAVPAAASGDPDTADCRPGWKIGFVFAIGVTLLVLALRG